MNDSNRAMLFVFQRWAELLDPRADLTRRVRTLSPRTAIAEAVSLGRSKWLAEGRTRRGEQGEEAGHGIRNLESLVEEALELVSSDKVLFSTHAELREQAIKVLQRLGPATERDVLSAEILLTSVDQRYVSLAFKRMEELVLEQPKRLDDLDNVISSLVADLRSRGWADEALAETAEQIQVSCKDPSQAIQALSSSLSAQSRTFKCLVPVDLSAMGNQLPAGLDGAQVIFCADDSTYSVEAEVVAFDPVAAGRSAAVLVADMLGAASVFLEARTVSVRRDAPILVGTPDGSAQRPIAHEMPLVREQRIAKPGQLDAVVRSVWGLRSQVAVNPDPVADAVRFYDRAAATSDMETRFVLLWFGIERMVAGAKDTTGGLEGAVSNLVPPAITLGKMRREISAVCATLRDGVNAGTREKMLAIAGSKHPVKQDPMIDREIVVRRLMGDQPDFDALLAPIYQEYPGIVRWLCKLRKVLGPQDGPNAIDGPAGERLATYLSASNKRTQRQVLRLYRARNGLAHAGTRPALVHDLIGHASFYLTNLVAIAVHYRESNPSALPSRVFAERGAHFALYMDALRAGNPRSLEPNSIFRPRGFAT